MNALEVSEITAGEETDRLIAERVFSFENKQGGEYKDSFGDVFSLPPFSTAIEYAWEIQELLWENGYSVKLERRRGVQQEVEWVCNAVNGGLGGRGSQSVADTAELALCRIALLILPLEEQ